MGEKKRSMRTRVGALLRDLTFYNFCKHLERLVARTQSLRNGSASERIRSYENILNIASVQTEGTLI